MDIITPPLGYLVKTFKLLRGSAISAPCSKITERLRKSACKFQLEYTNYHFSSSRLHKDFKEATGKDKAKKYEDFNNIIESGLKKIFGDTSSQIENYFKETRKSSYIPRVGIHLLTEDNELINVIQISENETDDKTKKIEDFTPFQTIVENGRPYLDNNIPNTVIKKNEPYKHKGIDINKVQSEYKLRLTDSKILSRRKKAMRFEKKDSKWSILANNGNSNQNITMYKSHIMIPITFRRHAEKASLSSEMIRVLKLEDNGRSILGFLCVDHPDTYYFDDADPHGYKNIDINSLIYFADMLSFVIVTKLMYTSGSETIEKFKQRGGT